MSYADKHCFESLESEKRGCSEMHFDDVDELSPLRQSDIFVNIESDFGGRPLTFRHPAFLLVDTHQ